MMTPGDIHQARVERDKAKQAEHYANLAREAGVLADDGPPTLELTAEELMREHGIQVPDSDHGLDFGRSPNVPVDDLVAEQLRNIADLLDPELHTARVARREMRTVTVTLSWIDGHPLGLRGVISQHGYRLKLGETIIEHQAAPGIDVTVELS